MSKYGNRKTIAFGKVFDSKKEANRYCELHLLEKAGKIKSLRCQVKYELIAKQKGEHRNERNCTYIADFVYEQDGKEVVEDTKGVRTAVYVVKRKLMLEKYGISIVET